ncbi:MAG: SIMPL domain-containing protein [Nanoarchaeota archaeon]|nr:SIMPL domain-containing protein [Nanoarchaeota archaeon]
MKLHIVLIILASLLLSGCYSAGSASVGVNDVDTLSVSGNGKAVASPDQIEINFAVETQSINAEEASDNNAKLVNDVEEALKKAGIKSKDIETSSFNLYPQYDYSDIGRQRLIGYTASHMLHITSSNIEKSGNYVDAAISAGANRVDGISFTLSDNAQKEFYKMALDDAVNDARIKADILADALGVKIKGVKSVSTESNSYPVFMAYAEKSTGEDSSFFPSDVDVQTTVSVVYIIE